MTGAPRHTFPKAEKLKSRKQIDLIFREGKSFFAAPVKCFYLISHEPLTDGQPEKMQAEGVKGETGNVKAEGPVHPQTSNPELQTQNIKPQITINHKQQTFNEKTSNLKAATPNPQPQITINHKQQTINLKAGFSVSKRNFKHSVDRNRIKRLLREGYRLHKHSLMDKLADRQITLEVFFVFTDRTLPTFDLVEEKTKYCLRRLIKIVEGGT